jgi:hypothetical protein
VDISKLRKIEEWISTPLGWIHESQIAKVQEEAGIYRYWYLEHWFWGFEVTQHIKNVDSEQKSLKLHLGFMNFELALRKAKHLLKESNNTIDVVNKAISFGYGKKYLPAEFIDETEMEGNSYGYLYKTFEELYPDF